MIWLVGRAVDRPEAYPTVDRPEAYPTVGSETLAIGQSTADGSRR